MTDRELEAVKKRMEWLLGFMVVRYHFIYQMMAMMTKECSTKLDTMGVYVSPNGQMHLKYNPEFVNKLPDEQVTYVLYHEVLHLALHHCTHRKFENHSLGNIACDLAVNELIPVVPQSCMPPKDGCFVDQLKKDPKFSDILNKQTAEWYYLYLRNKKEEMSESGFDDHDGWSESEIVDEKVRQIIKEIASTDTWGTMSATDKELILAAQTRKLNWRSLLRHFYGRFIANNKESTRKRPNRRTGYEHPGTKKALIEKHLVVVDTSGSTASFLPAFLSVINGMVDNLLIDIMQCDAGITEEPKPFDKRKKHYEFKGFGGTDFQPIIDIVDARKYKSVVILTDGVASPCTKPKTAKVVWVLPDSCKPPVEWGTVIHISEFS